MPGGLHVPGGYGIHLGPAADGVGLNRRAPVPVVTAEGGQGSLPLPAARVTTALQAHLRAAGLPNHFTMHSFRVGGSLSKSLAGTAVDEIMKIGGCKTESVAKHYIGATSSEKVHGSKKKRGQSYASADELPLSPEFQKNFAACGRKD